MLPSLSQTVILTALPYRVIKATNPLRLGLSVLITPRLRSTVAFSTQTLANYPDWVDFPAVASALQFLVQFRGMPNRIPADVTTRVFSSEAWRILFPPTLDVVPFQFTPGASLQPDLILHSAFHDFLRAMYGTIMSGSGDTSSPSYGDGKLPTIDFLMDNPFVRQLVGRSEAIPPFAPDHRPDLLDGDITPPLSVPAAESDVRKAVDQLRQTLNTTIPESETSAPPKYDFHDRVSVLGSYPALLAHLGLVVNLEVSIPPGFVLPPNGIVTMSIAPESWKQAVPTTIVSMNTSYLFAGNRFYTATGKGISDVQDGYLRLDDEDLCDVVQVEAVNGILKADNMATNVAAEAAGVVDAGNTPKNQGLPSLVSGGLQVVRKQAMELHTQAIERALRFERFVRESEGATAVTMPSFLQNVEPLSVVTALDVALGFRLDVFDDRSKQWHSVHRRRATYELVPASGDRVQLDTLTEVIEEGFVQPTVTQQPKKQADGSVSDVDTVSDLLLVWKGWSLSVSRPGVPVNEPDPPTQDLSEPMLNLRVVSQVEPGSLPRLRFGFRYNLRVRMVDLAGRSIVEPSTPEFTEAPPQVSPEILYRRFEPVDVPPMLMRAQPSEGESLERMVVRSAPGNPSLTFASSNERFFAPPKSPYDLAEFHGRLDAQKTSAKKYALAAREYAGLLHQITPPLVPGTGYIIDGREYAMLPGVKKIERVAQGNETKTLETLYIQENDTFPIVYLPDWAAVGVRFRGLPDGQDRSFIFPGAYPDLQPFRLELKPAAAGKPAKVSEMFAADGNGSMMFTIELPAGTVAQVVYSTQPRPNVVEKMGIVGWVELFAPKAELFGGLAQIFNEGDHPGITPYRTLTLVHAVQQPLTIPQFMALALKRQLGQFEVQITSGLVNLSASSVSKIDIYAEWEDPVDRGGMDPGENNSGVWVEKHSAYIGAVDTDGSSDSFAFGSLKQTLSDVIYHDVTYRVTATTRFREYFPTTLKPNDLIRPTPTEQSTPAAGVASIKRKVPNAVRPPAPVVRYAIPTFEWEETTQNGFLERKRKGNGLRVYLDRPWFTSGADEQLAVVLRHAPRFQMPILDNSSFLAPYVTQWGTDPIADDRDLKPFPTSADFVSPARATAPRVSAGGLLKGVAPRPTSTTATIAERENTQVEIVSYPVQFDPERHLWYSDIVLKPVQAYFPFVALALARYQPNSVSGAELSRIVKLDPVQIAPDRAARFLLPRRMNFPVGGQPRPMVRLEAYLRGVFPKADTPRNRVLFCIDRMNPALESEFGWETVTVLNAALVESQGEDRTYGVKTSLFGSQLAGRMRLRIVEFEEFSADSQSDPRLKAGIDVSLSETYGTSQNSRIVYVDTFDL